MSLSYRQRKQLRRIDARLRRSDPELRAKFTMFGRLYQDQDMPATERAPQARSGHQGRLGPFGPSGPLGWEAGIDQTDG